MRRFVIFFLPTAVLAFMSSPSHADPRTDCPDAKPCKVITLTPDEEKALFGEKMVFETAVQARAIDLTGVAVYFRNKVSSAPAGDTPKPESSVAK